jgi:VCBS repeat protein/Big-like domain-containing protein/FG-GAP repeat protein
MASLPTGSGFKLEDGTDLLPPDAPQVGWSVSNIGDINFDGLDDFIIGAPSTSNGAGRVYVVFGKETLFTSPVDLTNLGAGGFIIEGLSGDDLGAHVGDQLGFSVSAAGDVNHDGVADLIIGAPKVPSADGVTNSEPDLAGQAFVIFGHTGTFSNIDLSTPSTAFISISGIVGSQAGWTVADAGDVNGDAIADFIVGSPAANSNAGDTYVIYGSETLASLDLATFSTTDGFVIHGTAGGQSAEFASPFAAGNGDFNGDNIADVIVGQSEADGGRGDAYVVLGQNGNLADIDLATFVTGAGTGFHITNTSGATTDHLGQSVSFIGDFNGDLIDDIIVGAPGASKAYVIFGHSIGIADIDVADLDGSNGFALSGGSAATGFAVSGAGDVNGDGFADIIVGAPNTNTGAGRAYVVFGGISVGATGAVDLSTLTQTTGVVFDGSLMPAAEGAGFSVSAAGNINGDDFADLIVGAPNALNAHGDPSGAAYVIYGINPDIADDNVTIDEDSAGTDVDVLANDSFENELTSFGPPAHGTVTRNTHGTATLTDDSLIYTPDPNFNGTDSFSYTVTSGGVMETATVHVTVEAVDDVPQLAGFGDTSFFTENGASVLLDSDQNTSVSDVELDASANNYAGATLLIARNGGASSDDFFAGTGTLDLVDSNGLGENVSLDNGATFIGTFSQPGDGTFSIAFNANATAADINSVMRQIVYSNTSDNPPASVQIDFIFSDGNGETGGQDQGKAAGDQDSANTATGSFAVAIDQVNDSPQLLNVAPTAAYVPGSSGSVLSSGLVVLDVDATPPSPNVGIKDAIVTIQDFVLGDQLFVNLPKSGGSFIVDDGSGALVTNIAVQSSSFGRLVLTGPDTTLHYQLVLDAVSYTSTAADPAHGGIDPTRTITWQVNDGATASPLLAPMPPANVGPGTNLQHIATADFNGDSIPDLATANANTNSVAVLLGNSNGTFGVATTFPAGLTPFYLAVGEFNGDGIKDLAVANVSASGGVSVLLGNGSGGFGAPTGWSMGANTTAVAVGDFNNDGKADLAATNGGSGTVSVRLGDGAGAFATAPIPFNIGPAAAPSSLTIGDFNNDGNADLAVTNQGPDTITVLLGNGTGVFAPSPPLPPLPPGSDPNSVVTADFNGDGILDLATANRGNSSVSVLLGIGPGLFGAPTPFAVPGGPVNLAITDINGDGTFDLAVATLSGFPAVLLGNGNGTFAPGPNLPLLGPASGVAPGDYDGDGAIDLALANVAGVVPVLLNTGTNMSNVGTTVLHFVTPPALDLDLSGAGTGFTTTHIENGPATPIVDSDVVISDPDDAALFSAQIVLTDAKPNDVLSIAGVLPGGIDSSIDTSIPGQITIDLLNSATLADYQTALGQIRFSTTDLSLADRDIAISVSNDLSSNIAHATVHVAPPNIHPSFGFDFNADGRGDILWQNANGTPAVWLMNGTDVSAFGPALPNQVGWKEIDSGDFNADGKSDILWQNTDGTPAVWLMNGVNLLSAGPALLNPGPTWHADEAADFNGDGKADILWQNNDGTPAVWLMDGVNLLSAGPALANPGPTWQVRDAADFNGDGKADILWQNANGTPAVWLMNGTDALQFGPPLPNPGPSWHEIAGGDFNGDGKADILWQNTDGTPAVWLMDGVNVLSIGPPLANPGASWHAVEAEDVNNDGKADILWQNTDGTPAVWLMNGTAVSAFGPPLLNPGSDWHVI